MLEVQDMPLGAQRAFLFPSLEGCCKPSPAVQGYAGPMKQAVVLAAATAHQSALRLAASNFALLLLALLLIPDVALPAQIPLMEAEHREPSLVLFSDVTILRQMRQSQLASCVWRVSLI